MIATKLALAAAIAAASGAMAFAPQASASDGTITITGKVINPTCSLSNGTNGNIAKTLGNVTIGSGFQDTADTAESTKVELQLSNCPANAQIGIVLGGGSGIDTNHASIGLLTNQDASPAPGVEVQLLQSDAATPIDLSQTDSAAQGTALVTPTSGDATFDYYAQYYVTDGSSLDGGGVKSVVDYTITYQ